MGLLVSKAQRRRKFQEHNDALVRRVVEGFRFQALWLRSRLQVVKDVRQHLLALVRNESADVRVPTSVDLLTQDSAKIIKARQQGIGIQNVLYLAPALSGGFGLNVCTGATVACFLLCLSEAGKNGLSDSRNARRWRTLLLMTRPDLFGALLALDMRRAVQQGRKHDLPVSFRLDGTSDLGIGSALSQFLEEERGTRANPPAFGGDYDGIFYDYTAIPSRLQQYPGSRCHLTLSYKGSNAGALRKWFETEHRNRGSAAVVYVNPDGGKVDPLPTYDTIGGVFLPVSNFDINDARYLDSFNSFGALQFKHPIGMPALQRKRGFAAGLKSGFLRVVR